MEIPAKIKEPQSNFRQPLRGDVVAIAVARPRNDGAVYKRRQEECQEAIPYGGIASCVYQLLLQLLLDGDVRGTLAAIGIDEEAGRAHGDVSTAGVHAVQSGIAAGPSGRDALRYLAPGWERNGRYCCAIFSLDRPAYW